jgi:hypothetical protein
MVILAQVLNRVHPGYDPEYASIQTMQQINSGAKG